jgi:hypothetical protein
VCCGCWQEYLDEGGVRVPVTDRIRAAVDTVRGLYAEHFTGGAMHITVDDWNLNDASIVHCRPAALAGTATERACYEVLAGLTEAERHTVMALHDECIPAM